MSVAKPPDVAKLINQLTRLALARLHFNQAKALAEKIIAELTDPLDLMTLSPQIAVTTNCWCFRYIREKFRRKQWDWSIAQRLCRFPGNECHTQFTN
jgi:hypothetical protein